MNVQAEKIDKKILAINKQLLLISHGLISGTSIDKLSFYTQCYRCDSIDFRPLNYNLPRKIDTSRFIGDKYALDMAEYTRNQTKILINDGNILNLWKIDFIEGLKSLLVECSGIEDDIARECFVSRVYRWFTEKLTEERQLARTYTNG